LTRRDKILTLLEHYQDVVNGLFHTRSGEGVPGMCRAWKHVSYRQLERLVRRMHTAEPVLWWNLTEMYARSQFRRVAVCPRCETRARTAKQPVRYLPASYLGKSHKHEPRAVDYQPRIMRDFNKAVRPELVELAIAWLDKNWRGDPSLPPDLLDVVNRSEASDLEEVAA
jgi:hypothetical protein